ncbi:PREDICTED: extracellular calcium-sensing receptor-like [Nanorana parkeri]|uniref:extracellular calcium-sensing receptor-like n=1 Tax=Nanorana parkeri TaxID=125878 RepID=UPI0008545A58|nr:PREDICTED: extracellular calcium-sensing receptor-like [Nanorana parkeri]
MNFKQALLGLRFLFLIRTLAEKEIHPSCIVDGHFDLTAVIRKGDVDIGGIFSANYVESHPDLSFQSDPEKLQCSGFSVADFQAVQTMIFTIEVINESDTLLPNLTLGYRIYDTCYTHFQATRSALLLTSGVGNQNITCEKFPLVPVIVGGCWSTQSIAVTRVARLFSIPVISYFSTCACLSNKHEYPTFLRTVPSDLFQSRALAQLVQHFKWTWIGLIVEDNDYGKNAGNIFKDEATQLGFCVAFYEIISAVATPRKISQSVRKILLHKVNVVLIIASELIVGIIFQEVVYQNISGIQWIASEAWSTSKYVYNHQLFTNFGGTIGFAIDRGDITGLKHFLVNTHLSQQNSNPLISNLWEYTFNCSINNSVHTGKVPCTGLENLNASGSLYLDVSNLRTSYNVYKAVYAVGHGLHSMIEVNGFKDFLNNQSTTLKPWKLLRYLKRVKFTTDSGDEVSFDQNGDPYPSYDLVNWQKKENGSFFYANVGEFSGNKDLKVNEHAIIWQGDQKEIPVSLCSISCPPGSRKAGQGKYSCCFDCVMCEEGKISNQTDSLECLQCPLEYWPNTQKDSCVPKELEYISFKETLGSVLFGGALLGIFLATSIIVIFIYHRYNPVVRANNSHLSFCALFSIVLCLLSSITYLGQPSTMTCLMRNTGFGITFTFCISCILGKTIVVIVAFNVQHPDRKAALLFSPIKQKVFISLCNLFQIVVCAVWNILSPPQPVRKTTFDSPAIILQCDAGSLLAFSLVLGYIGLLVCVCFTLAFCARNLPYHYNEAKLITFSMVTVSAVWITFIPTYLSTSGKYLDAVEMFAILFSCYGLLICIFIPKCYMILLQPHKKIRRLQRTE